MRKLALFDIDGTLLRGHGAGGRAMRRAAEAVLGERCRGAELQWGGALDPWILRQLAEHGGYTLDEALLAAFRSRYRELLIEELALAERRCEALPGALDLLALLRARRPATLGLLTGNYADTGAIKLRAAGIDPGWFEIAAWGDMAEERPGLVKVALEQLGAELAPEHVIVIGDTVRDVHCAHHNGALCIAVATGGSTRAELEAAGADIVLDDLRDPEPLLRLL
jgi:phosphoglycolate phosphatase-like HAD superfamily hydrolase